MPTPSRYVVNQIDEYPSSANSHLVIGQEFDEVLVVIDGNFAYDNNGELSAKRHPNPDYLFERLFYQNITRARKKLCLVVIDNPKMFECLLAIKNQTIDFKKPSERIH